MLLFQPIIIHYLECFYHKRELCMYVKYRQWTETITVKRIENHLNYLKLRLKTTLKQQSTRHRLNLRVITFLTLLYSADYRLDCA